MQRGGILRFWTGQSDLERRVVHRVRDAARLEVRVVDADLDAVGQDGKRSLIPDSSIVTNETV